MIPILLSGVLIHSYATFGFTTLVISLIAVYAMFTPGAALESPNIIFFYLFAGLVAIVLRSLEKSTFQLRREAAESNTILSSLRGSYILTDKNYHILRLNERTFSIFPTCQTRIQPCNHHRDTKMEISDEDLQHLIKFVIGVKPEESTDPDFGNILCGNIVHLTKASHPLRPHLWKFGGRLKMRHGHGLARAERP
jgi:hypothetical protein